VNALKRLLPIALVLTAGCGYNTIQTYDEQVNAAASQIKVQLQRRADLVPNLVEQPGDVGILHGRSGG